MIRTIKDAAAYFKTLDPQTAMNECAIRRLLRSGAVPCVKIGKKYLVSIEALESYLVNGDSTRSVPKQGTGRESRKEWKENLPKKR